MKKYLLIVSSALFMAAIFAISLSSCGGAPYSRRVVYYSDVDSDETVQTESRTKSLEERAWELFIAGARGEAERALLEALGAGLPPSARRAILEFRLAASTNMEEARLKATQAFAQDIGDRAKRAIAVMLGDVDIRDVSMDSPESAKEYATWLDGYRQEAPIASLKSNPLIVVSPPESHGADEATVQIARLACRDALSKHASLRVVDASSREAALTELETQLASKPAGARDQVLGELFSADYVASGSLVATDEGWLVAWTLSSTEDGRIISSDFSLARDHAAIMAAANRFANAITTD